MDQKFVSFDDAVKKLGISGERLTKLRESGKLRAYRDGASWKFRTDEIERVVSEGIPDDGPESDISIIGDDDLMPADQLPDFAGGTVDDDDLQLAFGDDDDDDLDLSLTGSGLELSDDIGELPLPDANDDEPSKIDLAQDDTVTAEEPNEEGPEASDSILLSEEEMGEAVVAPPSTIIGRDEVDADLELELDAEGSDVELAPSSGASHVLSSDTAGSGVLSDLEKETGATDAFADLDELEIDLTAESSRALAEEDAQDLAAQTAAAGSDVSLGDLDVEDDGTDPVPAAADASAEAGSVGDSDIDLASDEDFVLAESGGSDITLDSGDSGINLVSPSDSGLALDDIPLDVGGSAILSSLSLDGEDDVDISLVGDVGGDDAEPLAELEPEDDFNLTPMGAVEDEGDSSSQVIALDADMEDFGAEEEVLGTADFAEVDADAELGGDYGDDAGLGVAAYSGAAAVKADSDYNVWSVLALGCGAMLLALAAIMLTDMIRNIWGWQQGLTLNSWILDGLLGMFGLKT